MAKSKEPPRDNRPNPYQPNVWGALRDIGTASINKGQFPFFCVLIVVVMMIYKMPQAEVARLAFTLLNAFKNWHYIGWILCPVLTISWWVHSRFQRKSFASRIKGISSEKKELQERLLDMHLPSTNERK